MKSSIKIDFADVNDGKGLQPVIVVNLIDSDDVRDGLLKTYFQSLGYLSSYFKMQPSNQTDAGGVRRIVITAVPSHDMYSFAEEVKGRLPEESKELKFMS